MRGFPDCLFSMCKGDGYWHLHVGGFPNWFQVRVNWRPFRLVVTWEDNR